MSERTDIIARLTDVEQAAWDRYVKGWRLGTPTTADLDRLFDTWRDAAAALTRAEVAP